MAHYSASMTHSEETIRQLAKVQYNVFGIRIKMMLFLLCFVWLYFGLFANLSGVMQMICLMGGCFTAVSIDMPAKRNADKILEQLGGRELRSRYEFLDDGFTLRDPGAVEEEPTHVAYTDIVRLIEDRTHYYMFINRYGAYVIDKRTVAPDKEAFRTFMQEACGQKWSLATGLLGLRRKKLKRTKRK